MAGYHLKVIKKGILGDFTKVEEEFEEFLDAYEQSCTIMALVELSDFMGALKHYYVKHNKGYDKSEWEEVLHYYSMPRTYESQCSFEQLIDGFKQCQNKDDNTLSLSIFLNLLNNYLRAYNININDLIRMSEITERAFVSGERK